VTGGAAAGSSGGASESEGGLEVACVSDLHVDALANRAVVAAMVSHLAAADPPDALVVAGDISADAGLLEETLATLAAATPGAVRLFVPGNHDVWVEAREDEPAASRTKHDAVLPAAARRAGFHALGASGPVVVRGAGFAGTMGWYDYAFRGDVHAGQPEAFFARRRHGAYVWMDRHFVRFGEDDPAVAQRLAAGLARDLAALAGRADVHAIVAVTHVLPYRDLVRYSARGDEAWDYCCAFLGSPRLGEAIDAAGEKVRLVVCGHHHVPQDRVLRGKRVLLTPLGYPGREWSGDAATVARERLRRLRLLDRAPA
jgi:Icc-related predicted phosphoesterase